MKDHRFWNDMGPLILGTLILIIAYIVIRISSDQPPAREPITQSPAPVMDQALIGDRI